MSKFWCLVLCLPSLCRADVLPPDAYELQQRASKNPAAYDRADAYCAGKAIGAPCEVPGNAFEGGGKGGCEQLVNRSAKSLDALCRVSLAPVIERRLPEGGYRVDSRLCELAQRDPSVAASLKREQASCNPSPALADQFCDHKKAGDVCQVELSQGGQRASYAGKCAAQSEESRFYHYGYNIKQRDVILCQPEKTASHQMERSSPSSWLKKIFE